MQQSRTRREPSRHPATPHPSGPAGDGSAGDFDLVIAGGGLVGTTLALAAVQAGMTAAVVDPQPPARLRADDFDGRAYALALGSVRLLEAVGLWQRLAAEAQPILEIKVSDAPLGAPPSPFFMHFHHGEIEEGPMGQMVEDRHLRRAALDLVAELADAGRLRHVPGRRVVAEAADGAGVTARLDDGGTLRGRVLVAADGRRSALARRARIRRIEWDYGQTAIVTSVRHERPHGGIAHQLFLPAGPFAILPLRGTRSAIVWSERAAEAERILAGGDGPFHAELRRRFGDFLGKITVEGGRFSYPLGLSVAESMTGPRLALVGDAAHGVHPIAGQGLNAGFRDIGALVEVLAEAARRGEDIGSAAVLARYAAWRRFDVTSLALATDAFNRLFSNDNPLLRLGRDLGLGVVGAIAPLRRALIREAAGLSGEVPRLLRGLRP